MIVPTISLIIASPINMFLNWLLVWGPDRFRLGFIGAPISTAISFNVMFLFSAIYCVFFAPRTAWGGFTTEMFRNLKPNIILGAAGFASVASEWWAWEVIGIASAFLGTDNLGANSVLGTSASLLYQLPAGLTVAVAVRVYVISMHGCVPAGTDVCPFCTTAAISSELSTLTLPRPPQRQLSPCRLLSE